jgi:hypothetical protein
MAILLTEGREKKGFPPFFLPFLIGEGRKKKLNVLQKCELILNYF